MNTREMIRQIANNWSNGDEINKLLLEDYLRDLVRQAKKEAYNTIIQKAQSEINWL